MVSSGFIFQPEGVSPLSRLSYTCFQGNPPYVTCVQSLPGHLRPARFSAHSESYAAWYLKPTGIKVSKFYLLTPESLSTLVFRNSLCLSLSPSSFSLDPHGYVLQVTVKVVEVELGSGSGTRWQWNLDISEFHCARFCPPSRLAIGPLAQGCCRPCCPKVNARVAVTVQSDGDW